jgi:pimeloyl-ACP methyl ester carboxylesterase
VKNISCSLLMVGGDKDPLLPIKAVAEVCGLVEHSKLLNIPFAAHAAFEDQQEIFMLSLNHFLDIA